jgi:hypothetical protein
MLDGERLMPMDTAGDYDMEDEEGCMIEVIFK